MPRMEHPIICRHQYSLSEVFLSGIILCISVWGGFLAPHHASAMVVRGGEVYEVASSTTLEGDLYFLGKTFTLAGTSTDDLVAFGSTIALQGAVGGDVLGVGGTIHNSGRVTGDMRLGGGEVTIASSTVIGEDLIVLGGTIVIEKGSTVRGDLLVYGDRLVLDGVVEGAVEAHVNMMEIRGEVGHDTNVTARESVSLLDKAHVKGAFLYSAPREVFKSDTALIDGEVSHERTVQAEEGPTANVFPMFSTLLLMIVMALIFIYVFPQSSREVSRRVLTNGVVFALKSLVLLIAWPLAGLFLCLTLIGIVPGLLVLVGYLFVVMLSFAFVPVVAGVVLARWLKKEDILAWDWTILGAVCVFFVGFLPFIGFLVRLALFVTTFGVFTYMIFDFVRSQKKQKVPAVTMETTKEIDNHDAKASITQEVEKTPEAEK